MHPKTFYVANQAQKIIMEQEMMGQLSDGMWENSRPYDHWKPWCDSKVEVALDGKTIGRTFWADKTNYNFASGELLSAIGYRIINKVRASLLGFDDVAVGNMPDDVDEYENWITYSNRESGNSGYFTKQLQLLNEHGINAATMQAIQEWNGYTYKDLVADCKALKVAARTFYNKAGQKLS